MAQITIRLPDDLLEQVEDRTNAETSRSEWIRQAVRYRLADSPDDLADRLERLDRRVSQLEESHEQPLIRRLLR